MTAYPRLSPDGTRVVVHTFDREQDLWIWMLDRATLTRATFDAGRQMVSVWTPDSRRLVFSSGVSAPNLAVQTGDGTGTAVMLTESANTQYPADVTRDGAAVVFYEFTSGQQRDIQLLTLGQALDDDCHRFRRCELRASRGVPSPSSAILEITSSCRTCIWVIARSCRSSIRVIARLCPVIVWAWSSFAWPIPVSCSSSIL